MFRKSLRARLWLGGLAVALFVATLVGANCFLAPAQPFGLSRVGHDFLPFYVAGSLVREGRAHEIYDLAVVRERERQVARESGVPLGAGFGPFWNPPFYALPFAPLSTLPYRTALLTWLAVNLTALAGAMVLLCRIVAPNREPGGWRNWGLVPLLLLASTPFLLALTHGQNTFCSLLLLTAAAIAWRNKRGVFTGLLLGLLSYKPQLAALVGLVALIDLGWRVALGALLSGGLLLVASVLAMPGIVETYLEAMPRMLRFMQVEQPYMWERHATLRAFWRLLLQGRGVGEANVATNVLTLGSAGLFTLGLLVASVRCRAAGNRGGDDGGSGGDRGNAGDGIRRDRLIAATIAAMPLVMPFYFDYDLLLLAIPAVLYGAERMGSHKKLTGAKESRGSAALRRTVARRSRGTLAGGMPQSDRAFADRCLMPACWVLYVWLTVNPDVALRTRVNLAVPLLAVVAGALLARALRPGRETAQYVPIGSPAPPLSERLAAAA